MIGIVNDLFKLFFNLLGFIVMRAKDLFDCGQQLSQKFPCLPLVVGFSTVNSIVFTRINSVFISFTIFSDT